VRQVAWCSGGVPKDWQTALIIPIHKKEDRRECINYRGISLHSFPGKVYAKSLEKRCREIIELKLYGTTPSDFRPGRSTTNQIFTLQQISSNLRSMPKTSTHVFSTSRKHTTGFLVKSLGRVAGVRSWQPPVTGSQVTVFLLRSLCRCGWIKSQLFTVCAGLQEGCVLSPLLFIFRMNWIDSRSRVEEGVTVGSCKINRLLFVDDLVFLASSQETSASRRSVFCCVRPSRNKN